MKFYEFLVKSNYMAIFSIVWEKLSLACSDIDSKPYYNWFVPSLLYIVIVRSPSFIITMNRACNLREVVTRRCFISWMKYRYRSETILPIVCSLFYPHSHRLTFTTYHHLFVLIFSFVCQQIIFDTIYNHSFSITGSRPSWTKW